MVRTEPKHALERQSIRETWGSTESLYNHTLRVVFVMGEGESVERKVLARESAKHKDMWMIDIRSAPANQTQIQFLSYSWVVNYCAPQRFLVQTEDASFLNMKRIIRLLHKVPARERRFLYYGEYTPFQGVSVATALQQRGIAWSYCVGPTYILSASLLAPLVFSSFFSPLITTHADVEVGKALHFMNVEPSQGDRVFFQRVKFNKMRKFHLDRYCSLSPVKPEEMKVLFADISCCVCCVIVSELCECFSIS